MKSFRKTILQLFTVIKNSLMGIRFKNIFKLEDYNTKIYSIRLFILCIGISLVGILAIGSVRSDLLKSQMVGLVVSVVIMLLTSLVDYKFLTKYYIYFYVLSIILLFLVFIIGDSAGGAQRWLKIGPVRFQPSEVVKIFLIIFFSEHLKNKRLSISEPKEIIKFMILLGIPLLFILKQPDLSTTIVTFLTIIGMYFIAGISAKIIRKTIIIGVPAVIIFFILALTPWHPFLEDYQQVRILSWLHPEDYADGEAVQTMNSITAIASGKFSGKGINNNKLSSLKNGNFVIEGQTDFIFAIIGEELGFVGSFIVIILLLSICIRCIRIGSSAGTPQGELLSIGIGALIGFQSFVNLGVATGTIPNTGVTLPFVSYGVTSLMSMFLSIGIVQNIAMQPKSITIDDINKL